MGNVIPGGKKKREDRLGLEDGKIIYKFLIYKNI